MDAQILGRWELHIKVNINTKDHDDWTPLRLAVQNGYFEVVKLLIEEKASVDAIIKEDWTPLHLAAQKGYLAVVKLLIKGKANDSGVRPFRDHFYKNYLSFLPSSASHYIVNRVLADSACYSYLSRRTILGECSSTSPECQHILHLKYSCLCHLDFHLSLFLEERSPYSDSRDSV
jgi:ankyrin repeat protein